MGNDSSSIQDSVFKCVVATNISTARLIIGGKRDEITNTSVRGVFLSFIYKEIFSRFPKHDFARFTKDLKILLYKNSLMLAKIEFDQDSYDSTMYTDSLYMDSLAVDLEYCDYKLAFNFKDPETLEVARLLSTRNTPEVMKKIHEKLSYHEPVNQLNEQQTEFMEYLESTKSNKKSWPWDKSSRVARVAEIKTPEPKPDPEDWKNLEKITL